MNTCIICENVSKTFKGKKKQICALQNIDLKINEGEFIVLCGENGFGKSTLLKIMTGLLIPSEGDINVLGIDVIKHWKRLSPKIGVVLSNERCLYWKLTARENLEVFGNLYGMKGKHLKTRISKLLEKVGLTEFENQLVETYSTGMNRKLMLCKALIHNPKILFADEILNGLDYKSCVEITDMLLNLNRNGMTIVMVSHILHTLPEDCKLIIMKNGLIISEGPLSKLDINKSIKIKATIEDRKIEKIVQKEDLAKFIIELTDRGAQNIQVESDNIYDATRRVLL